MVVDVATSESHTLALKSDGSLWVSGYNQYGQLGDGTTSSKWGFRKIVNAGVTSIFAGYNKSAFIKEGGSLWVMGNNWYGQLGLGEDPDAWGSSVPIQLVDSGVIDVAFGWHHTLYLTQNGALWGMGSDSEGQLSNELNNIYTPSVIIESDVIDVAAGYNQTLFVKSDGSAWGIGSNYWNRGGQPPRSGSVDKYDEGIDDKEPVLIFERDITRVFTYQIGTEKSKWSSYYLDNSGGLQDYYSKIFSHGVIGSSGKYALLDDGTIWQLNGTNQKEAQKKQTKFKAFSANRDKYIVVKEDNSVWAYGANANYSGRFGSGHLEEFKNSADEWLVEDFYNPQLKLVSGEGDTDNSRFKIEGNQLIALESFDFEKQDSYSIRLSMETPEGLTIEAAIQVNVIDTYEGSGKAFKSSGSSYNSGWKQIDWFGLYFPDEEGTWNFHQHLGWIFIPLSQGGEGFWMWHAGQGWLWTSKDTFPWLFSKRLQTWLYFDPSREERRLYQHNANQWIFER